MKATTWKNIGLVCVILWVLILLTGSVHYVPITSSQAFGYDLGQFLILIVGLIFLGIGRNKVIEEKESIAEMEAESKRQEAEGRKV